MKRTDSEMCDCDICQRHYDTWDDLIALQESDETLHEPPPETLRRTKMAARTSSRGEIL